MIACCPVELIGCCQKFKSQLVPVPGGSPLLPQTASMCVCVKTMFVNKTFPVAAGGAWRMGRGESHFHVVPGLPLGPGHNNWGEMAS